MNHLLKVLIFFGLLTLVTGCASDIVVRGEFPRPLVEKLPLVVYVEYPQGFDAYTYRESGKRRAMKSLDFGQSQSRMFRQTFQSMFTRIAQAEDAYDLMIIPTVLKFEYGAPGETKSNAFEVSIRYRIEIKDFHSKEIADWVIVGYGRTPSAMLKSKANGFSSATQVALRDVGAQISIGFKRQEDIVAFLDTLNSPKEEANVVPARLNTEQNSSE